MHGFFDVSQIGGQEQLLLATSHGLKNASLIQTLFEVKILFHFFLDKRTGRLYDCINGTA